MNRRLLVMLVAGGTLAASACGAAPTESSAPVTNPTPSASTSGSGASSTAEQASSADLDVLQAEADQVLEDLFEADRDVDYRSIEDLTTRAVAARYRNQELLASIERLDPSLKVTAMASVEVVNDVEVTAADDNVVGTDGSVEVTYTDDDGAETTYTYTDIVFLRDGDRLLVADWRSDTQGMLASAAFLNTAAVDPVDADDVTVSLEPGYREPGAAHPFVEYVFIVDNGTDATVDVNGATFTTPDDETYEIQFGVADTAGPGQRAAARVGFEGPSVPVSGGTLTITLEVDGESILVDLEVPPFVDEDGDPEPERPIELDDVEFTASGTSAGSSASGSPS